MDPIYIVAIVVGALILFVAIWIGGVTLIAVLSGWRALAIDYHADRSGRMRVPTETYTLQTLLMGVSRHKNCITVRLYNDGVELTPMVFFRFAHPPLFIPRAAISDVQPHPGLSDAVTFRVNDRSITLRGRAAGSRFWNIDRKDS
jgi:hypothetical protein